MRLRSDTKNMKEMEPKNPIKSVVQECKVVLDSSFVDEYLKKQSEKADQSVVLVDEKQANQDKKKSLN